MNILFVADVGAEEVIGGAERVLNAYVAGSRKRGHRTTVLTLHSGGIDKPVDGEPPRRRPFSLLMRCAAISVELSRMARRDPPDVINLHQALSAFFVLLCPAGRSIPKVYTFHSAGAQEYATRLRRSRGSAGEFTLWERLNIGVRKWLEAYALKRSQCVVVLSEFSRKTLHDFHHVPPPEARLIPGGVDTVRFRPSPDRLPLKEDLAPGCTHLLFTVRNLVPRMGLENLVLAMGGIVRKHPGAFLIIGGEGHLKKDLDALIERLGLQKNIRLEGFIPEGKLPSYYQAADLFVLPTRMLEGFGLVAVEALACGTPVIGTPVGGIVETLKDLDERFVCEGTEPSHLSSRIAYFLDNPLDLARARVKCREYAEAHYDWDQVTARLEEVFETVIADSR